MIYFTELENLPTHDAKGEYLGTLVDLAINPSQNSVSSSSSSTIFSLFTKSLLDFDLQAAL